MRKGVHRQKRRRRQLRLGERRRRRARRVVSKEVGGEKGRSATGGVAPLLLFGPGTSARPNQRRPFWRPRLIVRTSAPEQPGYHIALNSQPIQAALSTCSSCFSTCSLVSVRNFRKVLRTTVLLCLFYSSSFSTVNLNECFRRCSLSRSNFEAQPLHLQRGALELGHPRLHRAFLSSRLPSSRTITFISLLSELTKRSVWNPTHETV